MHAWYIPSTCIVAYSPAHNNSHKENPRNVRIDYLDPLVEQSLNSCSERKGATETPILEAKVLHVQKKHHFHEVV